MGLSIEKKKDHGPNELTRPIVLLFLGSNIIGSRTEDWEQSRGGHMGEEKRRVVSSGDLRLIERWPSLKPFVHGGLAAFVQGSTFYFPFAAIYYSPFLAHVRQSPKFLGFNLLAKVLFCSLQTWAFINSHFCTRKSIHLDVELWQWFQH